MGDTANSLSNGARTEELARSCARILSQHNGEQVLLYDLRGHSTYCDFAILSTATSATHLSGLYRHAREFVDQNGLEVNPGCSRASAEDGWLLMDCNFLVVHLMTKEKRSFYELERLWYGFPKEDYSSLS